jgi:hypothetical protein
MENNFNPTLWRSFFGTDLFTQSSRYINEWKHLWNPYQNRIWGQKTAVWIDSTFAYQHYIEIPELRMVVDKRASMMSSAIPVLMDAEGQVIDSHWVLDLIAKPNPTQSWADVIYCLSVNDALWSSSFAYCPVRSFNVRNLIVPLPSDRVKINLSGRKLKQMDKEGLIDDFTFSYDEESSEKISIQDMIYLVTTDGINLVNPSSRLESLKFPLSNLKAGYHKRNVLLENIGAIGILSARNNDIGGAIPMTPEEKNDIRNDWYRRSKDELIITEAEVNWQPMSYPTKDLMLFEEMTADKMAIIDTYGLNAYLFSQEKGATFANVRDGIRMAYTDTIIPETEQMYATMSHQLGLTADGLTLVPDFSHIAVLQDDEESKTVSMERRAQILKMAKESGIVITEEEYRSFVGMNK